MIKLIKLYWVAVEAFEITIITKQILIEVLIENGKFSIKSGTNVLLRRIFSGLNAPLDSGRQPPESRKFIET